MKTFAMPMAALVLLVASMRVDAAPCAAEYHALELAVDTAEAICGGDDAELCAYARSVALDAGRAYIDCVARDSEGPQR